MRSGRRGFTLVELMVVVAIFAIVAWIALVSVGRTHRGGDLDGFATDVRNVLAMARRRAVTTRNYYLVSVVANPATPPTWSVSWCQVTPDPNAITPAVLAAVPKVCPTAPPAGRESARPITTRPGAEVVDWAQDTDQGQGVTRLPLPATIYFRPDGTSDSDLDRDGLQGFTLYLEGNPGAQSTSESMIKRKVYVLPFGGRPRVIDSW